MLQITGQSGDGCVCTDADPRFDGDTICDDCIRTQYDVIGQLGTCTWLWNGLTWTRPPTWISLNRRRPLYGAQPGVVGFAQLTLRPSEPSSN